MRRRAFLAAPILLAACDSGGTKATNQASPSPAVTTVEPVQGGGGTVPKENGKTMLGAYVLLQGKTVSEGLKLRKQQLGRPERIIHQFYGWTETLPASLPYVTSASYLMISWAGILPTTITSGDADKRIKAAAKQMKARKRPTLLRWGWDMNNRDPGVWGAEAQADHDPDNYVAAYRRIHKIFADQGAGNVSWVWSPNVAGDPVDTWNDVTNYYPGDDYVDWIGVNGYADNQTPDELFGDFYATWATKKPIMITEVAVTDRGGSTKPDWITAFGQWVTAHPGVGAVVWFDTDDHPGSAEKWRIDSTTTALTAYQKMAAEAAFHG